MHLSVIIVIRLKRQDSRTSLESKRLCERSQNFLFVNNFIYKITAKIVLYGKSFNTEFFMLVFELFIMYHVSICFKILPLCPNFDKGVIDAGIFNS